MLFRSLLSLTFLLGSASVLAQAEIHRAYETVEPDSVPASYVHDSLIKSMSVAPLVTSDELISASVGTTKGDAFLRIQVTEPARVKLDRVARANIRRLDAGASGGIVSLAIVVDGKILDIVNGAVHPLDQTTFSIWSSGGDVGEQMRAWQAIADAINRPRK